MYCLHCTSAWSVFLRAVGARLREGGDWEEEPVFKQAHKHSALPAKLTNSDRQLTHSSTQRPMSGPRLRQEAAHPPANALGFAGNLFYTNVSCDGLNSTSGFEMILLPSLTKASRLRYN